MTEVPLREYIEALFEEQRKAIQTADEEREKAATGIATLKVGYNRVHGYYIEIRKGQSAKAPTHYTRRQTLTGAERYITPRLKELEDRINAAREVIGELEASLYRRVCAQLAAGNARSRSDAMAHGPM